MIPVDVLTAFSLTVVLLALAPGPDNIFVLTQSAMSGRKAGLWVVLGLCSGLIMHTAAVAFGVAALIKASAVAFTALKLAGAAYLIYLAWQAFRAKPSAIGTQARELTPAQLYRRGLVMNVTNPKVAIFFLAFFPQFTNPAHGSMVAQIVLLGLIFIIATFCVFGIIALASGSLKTFLANPPKAQLIMNRIAGVVFVALAVKIATSKQ